MLIHEIHVFELQIKTGCLILADQIHEFHALTSYIQIYIHHLRALLQPTLRPAHIVSLIAQLVQHCSGIAGQGSSPR